MVTIMAKKEFVLQLGCKKIAIMQPTFIPWIGYFALINYVDEFIVLDSVQFDSRSWQQRNKILLNNSESLITIPVQKKGLFNQKINEVKIVDESQKHLKKIYKTIEFAYARSLFFSNYKDEFENIFFSETKKLSKFNFKIIEWICKKLNIHTAFAFSSDLNLSGAKDQLLVNICSKTNANVYISPVGSKVYLKHGEIFKDNNIDLKYFQYIHPIYSQLSNSFIPYLSSIDILFNKGPDALKIIKSGVVN